MSKVYKIAFVVLLASGRAWAQLPKIQDQPLIDDPLQATIHRLSNGITVYISTNTQEPRVAGWIAVRAGSTSDPPNSTGMAHYLEHMMFKGSERLGTIDYKKEKPHLDRIIELYEKLFSLKESKAREAVYAQIDKENIEARRYEAPNEIDNIYKALGFRGVNAFTGEEHTVFISNFPSNRLDVWARTEADRFSNPVFRMFQSEIEAVYEEKNRAMDNADRIISETIDEKLFAGTPLAWPVLGTIEHLKNPSLANMYAFYHKNYRPENIAIVLSGDVDPQEALPILEKNFGGWKAPGAPPRPSCTLAPFNGGARVSLEYPAEEKVVIVWRTASHLDPDHEALWVMDMIMDNAQAGILNLRLNQAQKVKASGSSPDDLNETGLWQMWAVTKTSQTLEQAEKLLLETADQLKAGDFSEEDVRAVITDFEVAEKLKLESNESRASAMAGAFTNFEDWPHAATELERFRKVTKADVVRVANKYLGADRLIIYRRDGKQQIPSIKKPNFTKSPIDPSKHSAFFKELVSVPAKPHEPHWLKEGADYRVENFPWGKLYAARNPMNDLFSIEFRFDRGRRQQRELCAALELLELSGAGADSAETFKKKLYALGSKTSIGCGEDQAEASLSGLEANFEPALELFLRRFDEPNVDAQTLERMIDVQIGAHRDIKKDPEAVNHALEEYALRGKESAVLNELSDTEVKALKLAALVNAMKSFFDFQRDALYIGVREPKTLGAVLSAHRKRFRETPPPQAKRLLRPGKPRVVFAQRDMVQSRVGVFAADKPFDPNEAVDLQYYNRYMGGMSGVFFQEVREALALAYSASGGYQPGQRKGDDNHVWAEAGTQADKTDDAAALMARLIAKFPASPERFGEARKSMEENYRFDAIRFRGVPEAIHHWHELGIEGDPRPGRFPKVLDYKLEDLTRFARRFDGVPLTITVLGNRERVDLKAISALGDIEQVPLDAIFPY